MTLGDTVLYLFTLHYKFWQVFMKLHYKVVLLWSEKWHSLQGTLKILPPSPPSFVPSSFPPILPHSSFTCLQWTFEMLALACMYPWQPTQLSHLDCLYGGWTPRLADVFNGWCSWKVFVQHHGQQCQHDTRPAISIYTTGVKREGRRHQRVHDILLHCPSHTMSLASHYTLPTRGGSRQEGRGVRGEGGTNLVPIPFHPGCTLFAM